MPRQRMYVCYVLYMFAHMYTRARHCRRNRCRSVNVSSPVADGADADTDDVALALLMLL